VKLKVKKCSHEVILGGVGEGGSPQKKGSSKKEEEKEKKQGSLYSIL